jgi:membrane protein
MTPPRLFDRLWRAYLGFSAHDGSLVAAAIAYYVALSFYPLILVLVGGYCMARGADAIDKAETWVFEGIEQQFSSELAVQVRNAIGELTDTADTTLTVGFVGLLITAIAIFVQIDYAFDRIWNLGVERQETWLQWFGRHVIARFKALVMLLAVGGFLTAAMIASSVWGGVQQALAEAHIEPWAPWLVRLSLNVALNLAVLTVAYKYVPKARIFWKEAFAAGLVTAPMWEVGRQLLALYFSRLNYATAYGIIGSFLVIMLWAYYAMLVVLFGAEYVRVRQRERAEQELAF